MAQHGSALLSGNEAVAHAAAACGVGLGVGYPGTPSTEILEAFAALDGAGHGQWSAGATTAAVSQSCILEAGTGRTPAPKPIVRGQPRH